MAAVAFSAKTRFRSSAPIRPASRRRAWNQAGSSRRTEEVHRLGVHLLLPSASGGLHRPRRRTERTVIQIRHARERGSIGNANMPPRRHQEDPTYQNRIVRGQAGMNNIACSITPPPSRQESADAVFGQGFWRLVITVSPLPLAIPFPGCFVVLGVRQEVLDKPRPVYPLVGVTQAADEPVLDGSYLEGFETAVGNVPLKDYNKPTTHEALPVRKESLRCFDLFG